jgi:hypothetical protein
VCCHDDVLIVAREKKTKKSKKKEKSSLLIDSSRFYWIQLKPRNAGMALFFYREGKTFHQVETFTVLNISYFKKSGKRNEI